jgi:hypothetical protein
VGSSCQRGGGACLQSPVALPVLKHVKVPSFNAAVNYRCRLQNACQEASATLNHCSSWALLLAMTAGHLIYLLVEESVCHYSLFSLDGEFFSSAFAEK